MVVTSLPGIYRKKKSRKIALIWPDYLIKVNVYQDESFEAWAAFKIIAASL